MSRSASRRALAASLVLGALIVGGAGFASGGAARAGDPSPAAAETSDVGGTEGPLLGGAPVGGDTYVLPGSYGPAEATSPPDP